MKPMRRWFPLFLFFAVAAAAFATEPAGDPAPAGGDDDKTEEHGEKASHSQDGHHSSRLTAEVIPLRLDAVPNRPKPLLELGEPFLGTGALSPGFELPTGAVWQPSLLVFATMRTGLQSNNYRPDRGEARVTEAAARLDLFTNLQLSGTERLVMGFRNFDQDGRFSGYVFESEVPGVDEGSQDELNAEVGTLFFEGDFGEIFPNLSPRDFRPHDVGFSIGRQELFFQEGILINDTVDGIGLTWNSLQPRKTSNFRTTFFYGWNNVNQGNLAEDSGDLFALLTSVDFPSTTMDFDLTYVRGEDLFPDTLAAGVSAVQRIGLVNTSFRALASSVDVVGGDRVDGGLLFSEVSWTPTRTHNLVYINNFWAIDTFASAAHGPANGGPLGRAGINFAAVGLGAYGAPLSAAARDVAGGAIGYQMFFNHTRTQLIVELAGRFGTEETVPDQVGFTARWQQAAGRHFVFILDGFVNHTERFDEDAFFGGRFELLIRL